MTFAKLCEFFEKLEANSSRLVMTEVLAQLFKEAEASEIFAIVHMSLGQLAPKFNKIEFQLAEKMVMRSIAEALGVDVNEVVGEYKKIGDLGEVMSEAMQQCSNAAMQQSVVEVYEKLVVIARESGEGSQERKVTGLAKLLASVTANEAKYIVRMVIGKLRLGFSDMTILDALSWMVSGDKSHRKQLEWAYQVAADVGALAKLVKETGIEGIEKKVDVQLGLPVVAALAQRLKTADEMIAKMGKVAVEPKYDGTRVQIHFRRHCDNAAMQQCSIEEWSVRTFTRNLDENSHMFPELAKLGVSLKVDSVILDSEAVGYDPKTGKMRPFQETIQRKRKHGVSEMAEEIPLKFFVFDVLFCDGKSVIDLPYHERRKLLNEIVIAGGVLVVTEAEVTESADEVRKFHAHQLAEGLEGAMVKKYEGVYEPGRRGWSWVKFKEAEGSAAKLSDTIDAVVMGLYVGKGKRADFGVGAFLIGVPNGDEFFTISKVGTGLSDEQWRELKERSQKFVSIGQPSEYQVDKNLAPDTWLSPGLVVEIAADEITKSPIHTAGLALRFPRLVRFRDDKDALMATSIQELGTIS